MPAAKPITAAAHGATKPAAGVIPTRPATRPEATPSAVGFLRCAHSTATQARAPAAAPTWVFTSASDASPPEVSALPALKPNQPNQRTPAPVRVIVRLW